MPNPEPARDRLREAAVFGVAAFVCLFCLAFVAVGSDEETPIWRCQPLEKPEHRWKFGPKSAVLRWDAARREPAAPASATPARPPPSATDDEEEEAPPGAPAGQGTGGVRYARRDDGARLLLRPDGAALPFPHKLLTMDWYGRTWHALQWGALAGVGLFLAAALLFPRLPAAARRWYFFRYWALAAVIISLSLALVLYFVYSVDVFQDKTTEKL
ncbi:MAG: hypothetical protein HY719_11035 [Planctomycetes bacterium]|nr:hypothetical protein [Planctomycetota bacterium]